MMYFNDNDDMYYTDDDNSRNSLQFSREEDLLEQLSLIPDLNDTNDLMKQTVVMAHAITDKYCNKSDDREPISIAEENSKHDRKSKKKLAPFEQWIDDLCTGKINL